MAPSLPPTPRDATGSDPAGRVTVVTVCYNSTGVIADMLAALPPATPVILVDNGSADAAQLHQTAMAHDAQVCDAGGNIGFGRGCNLGAARAETEFLLFLNPDTVPQPGALDALVAAADRNPGASAFNPALCRADGRPYFKRGSVLLPRAAWLPRSRPAQEREVPVLSGAALFVRRAGFEAVGGFDPAIFLYHEDDDLSLRLAAQVGKLIYVPGAEVRHSFGGSSGRDPAIAAFKGEAMGRSRVYAARKHGRPFAFGRALLTALAGLASPAALFSSRKRAKQIGFLRGVWQTGRGGGET